VSLLKVNDLHVHFNTDDGVVRAVNGLSFDLSVGETLGLVGESGSGKSVSCLALMGLLPSPPALIAGGQIEFDGQQLLNLSKRQMRSLRGNRIAMIFQDPMTSLNPFLKIGRQLTEVLELHKNLSSRDATRKAIEMLEKVGISDAEQRIGSYPHELSGGMRQRVMIAMSLLCEPALLIADEPTTALDVTIQAQILELLNELQNELGTAIILITHDLGVVAGTADRVLVMYGGQLMEQTNTNDLFANPQHPYTQGLLASIPRFDSDRNEPLHTIEGRPPLLTQAITGCPFAPRCALSTAQCIQQAPTNCSTIPDHQVNCWALEESSS